MKKDIEWAKKEIEKLMTEESQNYPHDEMVEKEIVLGILDQLDEPEVLSQEWIDEHAQGGCDEWVYIEDLQKLLVPKQDKPTIPQFVADYYNDYKDQELTFAEWFECPGFGKGGKGESKTFEWLLDNSHEVNIERQFILADIIAHGLDGYEVKKEKKYQVIIGDGEYIRLYLCKYEGNVTIGTNENYIEKCPEVTYLTEQEIKDYDKRFWAFAKEATE